MINDDGEGNKVAINSSNSLFNHTEFSQSLTDSCFVNEKSGSEKKRKSDSSETVAKRRKIDDEFDQIDDLTESPENQMESAHATPRRARTSLVDKLSPKNIRQIESAAASDQARQERQFDKRIQRRALFGRNCSRVLTPKPAHTQDEPMTIEDEGDEVVDEPDKDGKTKNTEDGLEDNYEKVNSRSPTSPSAKESKPSPKESSSSSAESGPSRVEKSENGIRTRILRAKECAKFISKKVLSTEAIAVVVSDDSILLCPSPTSSDVVYQIERSEVSVSVVYQLFRAIKKLVCFGLLETVEKLKGKG